MGWGGPILNINTNKSNWINNFDNLIIKPLNTESYLAIVKDISVDKIVFKFHKNDIRYEGDRKIISILKKDLEWINKSNNRNLQKKNYLSLGDVVYLSNFNGNGEWNIYQIPELQGAMIVMDPTTGRVLSMIGGYDYNLDPFNRATNSYKKPGSMIQPFIYLNALENGYEPNSLILDAPLIKKSDNLGKIEYKNYDNIYNGPSTLRFGLETSSNAMAMRLVDILGYQRIHNTFVDFGIYEDSHVPTNLDSVKTTLLRLTNAFASFANGGKLNVPTYVDKVQNKYGKTIYKSDKIECIGCDVRVLNNTNIPFFVDNRINLIEETRAYQMTSILEGAVKKEKTDYIDLLEISVAGKKSKADESMESWFVGYTPDVVVGIYFGYDSSEKSIDISNKSNLTEIIFKEFIQNFSNNGGLRNFRIPEGIRLIEVNKRTGKRFDLKAGETIMEAFVR